MAGKKKRSNNVAYRWEDNYNKSGYSACVSIAIPYDVAKEVARYVKIIEDTKAKAIDAHVLIGIYPEGRIQTGWNTQAAIDNGIGLTSKDLYQLLYDVIAYTKDEEKNGEADK